MFIRVYRNPKESQERLISRFQKKVTSSRKILKLKAARFFQPPKSKREIRAAAVMREFYRAQKEKMKFY